MRLLGCLLIVVPLALASGGSWGQAIDLSHAVIVARGDSAALGTVAGVLNDEVKRRTGLDWERVADASKSKACVELTLSGDLAAEGFRLDAARNGRILVVGGSARGLLFGAGYLLRKLDWKRGAVGLPGPLAVVEKPQWAIRGHQLGYRAQANSWDAWTPAQFDQYIRELALFGSNAIENIPFQDERESPLFKVSRREMNRRMSEICAKYDLAYWVWTPADFDLKDQGKRAAALKAHEELYADCPRLDGVFFPGGDPGDNHPKDVMPFLENVSKLLLAHHPKARVWVSPQGFHGAELETMFQWIEEHKPAWLGGQVGGPSSPPLDGLRKRLDRRYRLRDYPDITHIVRCEYPVLDLDQAFALTLGRECIMPRPVFETMVHRLTAPFTDGFISYSDGVHDDANKVLWSQLAWNSAQDPRDILIDYCRLFFGPGAAVQAADGLFALEKNWDGPIRHNGAIEGTLAIWKNLESAHPELKGNWRWQMYVLRAYYDAYTRERLFREESLEREANSLLARTPDRTPAEAMKAALAVLARVDKSPTRPDLRDRIVGLFDDLYQSIGLQSDTKRYHASGTERGCSLEFLDYPLNNRWWLEDELKKVAALPDASAQWARLEELRTWENPGPGSFYDDLGNLAKSPHVAREYYLLPMSGGFAWWDNGYSRARLSWQVTSWPRDGLQYNGLDPAASYVLRFTGFGDMKVKADDEELKPTRYGTGNGDIKEYPVPKELTKDGRLTVKVSAARLPGVNWRYQPRLAEAWLLKK